MPYSPADQARIDAAKARTDSYAARDAARRGALTTAAAVRAGVDPAAGQPAPAPGAAPTTPTPMPGTAMTPQLGTTGPTAVGTAPPWLQQQSNSLATGSVKPYEGAPDVMLSRPDYSGLPAIDTDFAGAAARGAEAAYKGATQFFDGDFARDRAGLETQLVNQGFARGSEAFDREMELMLRGQNAARENAGFMAQGVGHQQAGDLLVRALTARRDMAGERERDADRIFGQSMGVAELGLGARGQTLGADTSRHATAQSAANSNNAVQAQMRQAQLDAELARRRLGLDQDSLDFNQMMALIGGSRGGVNMPNFGAPGTLDVTGANSIASANSNSAAARAAADRGALAGLGAAALGNVDFAAIARNFGY